MHYLGSDIRGKTPEQLAYGKRADARDRRQLRRDPLGARGGGDPAGRRPRRDRARAAVRPRAPADRARALVAPAQGHRARDRRVSRGSTPTSSSSRASTTTRRFERYRAADIVVDQLNAGWYGLFAIEAMALGKPVVTFLHDEAVRRTEEAFGVARPDRLRHGRDAPRARCGRSSPTPPRRRELGAALARLRRARPRPRAGRRPPARPLRSPLDDGARARRCRRLGRHSAVYGLGGIVSRVLAVFLLPLYTRYLDPADFGAVGRRRADGGARDDPARRDLVARSSASTSTRRTQRSGGSSSAPRSGSRWRARRSGSSPASCSPSRSPTCSDLDDAEPRPRRLRRRSGRR